MNTNAHELGHPSHLAGAARSFVFIRVHSWFVFALLLMTAASMDAAEEGAGGPEAAHAAELAPPAPRPARLPDLTKGDKPPVGKHGPVGWNLGPTGIIGVWNHEFAGDQFLVLTIAKDSPAAGKVLRGDVILGVQGKDFVAGGHMGIALGNAIVKAEEEAGKGILDLHLWRDRNFIKRQSRTVAAAKGIDLDKMLEETSKDDAGLFDWNSEQNRAAEIAGFNEFPADAVDLTVTLQLEVMGTYSKTSPWDCPVAEKIRENAWKKLAVSRIRGMDRGWERAVALVASGKPEYIAVARKWVREQTLCQDINLAVKPKTGIYTSWHAGFSGLMMAIYYDATGDDYVLPEVRKRAIETAMGQGASGTWSHSFAPPQAGGKLHQYMTGYGGMHNAGSRCFFLIALAQKFGIDHPEINAAVARSSRTFEAYVDKGVLGYGIGAPVGSDDSNGKNCGVTYAFQILGRTHAAKHFAMHSAHASFSRRGGHGSNELWYYTPLSAAVAGPRGVQASMQNMRWFHTLARRHDGGFVLQGAKQTVWANNLMDPTARSLLFYSGPLEKTIVTGKDADKEAWFTDEEYEELLLSARGMVTADGKRVRGQITDPELMKQAGTAWNLRETDGLIELLDHFYPQMRRRIGAELATRYQAGDTDLLAKVLPLLESDDARMREGACEMLSACGPDLVLAHLSKVVKLLQDEAEFVRMTAVHTISRAAKPGDARRELNLLKAAAHDYEMMTADHANVRLVAQNALWAQGSKLATEPFSAGYDNELVRDVLETLVGLQAEGRLPQTWSRETVIRLAGPITIEADQPQLVDCMLSGARHGSAQALLRKHGFKEALDGDVTNLRKRQALPRTVRYSTYFKHPNVIANQVMNAPGRYREYLDAFYDWLRANPTGGTLSPRAKGVGLPLKQLVEIVEKDTNSQPGPSLAAEVHRWFQGQLAEAGDQAAQLTLCRAELQDPQRSNFFRKMSALSHLVKVLGADAVDDLAPYIGHQQWRLRDHARKLALELAKRGATEGLVALLKTAEGEQAADLLAVLGEMQAKPALAAAKSALKNASPEVRRQAVQAVFAIGGNAELKTVFGVLRQATTAEELDGCEQALLSKRDAPAHVKRVSGACITLLARSEPPLQQSLAWLLGQFGGTANLAALQKAILVTKDKADRRRLIVALAQSPDPAASETMLALLRANNTIRDEVASLSAHRMVCSKRLADMSDKQRVAFAREVMKMKVSDELVTFLGWVPTAQSLDLLFSAMTAAKSDRDHVVKSIMGCLELFETESKADTRLAREVVAQLIEYIEVKHLRGGADTHVKEWRQARGYAQWKAMQSRAAAILLTLGDTREADVPGLDDPDLDF
jgi:HEAT repeat protein